jgi:hypothetical protein
VSPGLGTLGHDHVSARGDRRKRVGDGRNHRDDRHPRRAGQWDDRGGIAKADADHLRSGGEAGLHQLERCRWRRTCGGTQAKFGAIPMYEVGEGEQVPLWGAGIGQEHVHANWRRGQRPCTFNGVRQAFCLHSAGAKDTKATGLRYCGDKLRRRRPSCHSGQEDR